MELVINSVLNAICRWMESSRLQMTPQKSEALALARKREYRKPVIRCGDHVTPVSNIVKHFGVHLGTWLTFRAHLLKTTASARHVAAAIGRVMPNLRSLEQCGRQLLMFVVHNKLLYYATPI